MSSTILQIIYNLRHAAVWQIPFSVYGKTVLRLLTFVVPLALAQYYPLLYLLEQSGSLLHALSPFLSLLFLIPTCLLYRIGLRRYQPTGS